MALRVRLPETAAGAEIIEERADALFAFAHRVLTEGNEGFGSARLQGAAQGPPWFATQQDYKSSNEEHRAEPNCHLTNDVRIGPPVTVCAGLTVWHGSGRSSVLG